MNRHDKLLKALGELIESGEGINVSKVEKRAKVSNGLAKYYDDVIEAIADAQVKQRQNSIKTKKSNSKSSANSVSKEKNDKLRERFNKVDALRSQYYESNKKLKKQNADLTAVIAALQWQIHNLRSDANTVSNRLHLAENHRS